MNDNVIVLEKKEDSQLTDQNAILQSRISKVKQVVGTSKVDFVLLGGYLNDLKPFVHDVWSDRKGRFCKDIFELAQQEFNLCKTTVKNVIGVATRFGYLFQQVKEEYKEYNYSQLVEMLPLSDEQLKLVSPAMTQQEIRALKKVQKEKSQLTDLIGTGLQNDPLKCQLELTNDKQRKEFITLYKHWGVWLEVPELNLKFYKIDLNNGDFLVVTEYPSFTIKNHWGDFNYSGLYDKESDTYSWHKCVVKKGTSPNSYGYDHVGMGDGELCTYFKSTHAKVICPFPCNTLEEYKHKVEVIERTKGR